MCADIKIIIDENSFQEAKEKLRELYVIAHAIRAETEKALEAAEALEPMLKNAKDVNQ